MLTARLLPIAALASTAVSAAADGPRALPIEVMNLRSSIEPSEVVGARRTGRLCGPAGSTRWSDAAPEPTRLADKVVERLRADGHEAMTTEEADDLPEQAARRRRLTLTVSAARIDACVPQHGLVRLVGGRRSLKVQGTVTVHWRLSTAGEGLGTPMQGDLVATIREDDAVSIAQAVTLAIATAVAPAVREAAAP